METNLLGASQGGASASAGIGAAFGGANDASELFTKLLVAQIQNQDPLEPTDPSQFVNQLTQLSQVESLQALTRQSAASTSMLQSMQVLALGAQVGSNVRVRSDAVKLDGQAVGGGFTLQSASAQTSLLLTGADGVSHELPLGTQKPGEVSFTIDPAALGLAPGAYALSVKTDTNETPVIEVAGQLGSVKLSASGGVALYVSHVGEVAPESVTQFNGRSDAQSN